MASSAEAAAGFAQKPELNKREFRVHTERVERLVSKLDSGGDPEIRAVALELVQSVMELHGAALERMLESISQTPAGEQALEEALEDDLIASVLLLHGLHPDPIETRVLRALEKVRPYLHTHSGDVELVEVHDGIVQIKLVGSCGSCPSSSITLKNAVEEALYAAAPDIVEIQAENSAAELNSSKLVVLK
jgi:Fe-S cluster biogenesis protein NfuA